MADEEERGLLVRGESDVLAPAQSKARRPTVWINNIARVETLTKGVVWKIRYRVPIAPGSTKTRQMPETLLYCTSRKQAESVLAKRRFEIFNGEYRPRSKQKPVTVGEMVEAFVDARGAELRDGARIAAVLRNHVARLLGGKYLFEVNTAGAEEYRRARLDEGASAATARKELRYLQMVFLEARKREIVNHDPVADVSFKGIKNARKRIPSDGELARLVAAALQTQPPLRAIFFALACTGMRISSVLSLRWDWMDFEHRWIDVVQKGGNTIRIPMSPVLCAEFARWRPISLATGRESGFVFPAIRRNRKGLLPPLSQSWVHEHWPELLKAAQVDGLTRHDMRRWMVTALRKIARGDDKAIGGVSGHAGAPSIDHYDQGALDRATELVGQTDLKLISAGATETIVSATPKDKKPSDL